tara:strand:+ start:56 stop:937 length:882 start_codon:yes stop_codon:yes gene_type:complete
MSEPAKIKIKATFKTFTKKKGLKRVADEKTTLQLQQLIDELSLYRAASSYKAHLRAVITGSSTKMKEHVSERLTELDQTAQASTSYGDVNILVVDKMAHNAEYYTKTLEALNIIEDFNDPTSSGMFKCKLVVKSTSLNVLPEVVKRTYELVDELEQRLSECKVMESDSVVDEHYYKFVAPRLSMAKDIHADTVKYNQIYNKIKVLFSAVSSTGTYPRVFSYKGFCMHWEDVFTSSNYINKVKTYISAKDFAEGTDLKKRFDLALSQFCKQDNLITHKYLLDQEDYLCADCYID